MSCPEILFFFVNGNESLCNATINSKARMEGISWDARNSDHQDQSYLVGGVVEPPIWKMFVEFDHFQKIGKKIILKK